MIICRNCQQEEPQGALFCSECGAKLPLKPLEEDVTKVVKVEQSTPIEPKELPENHTSPAEAQGIPVKATEPSDSQELHARTTVPLQPYSSGERPKVILHIVDAQTDLPLVERDEFTLGRVSEGQPLIPEIDLSVFKAYEQGVSRLHAVIGIKVGRVTITDLGSANGTWVNGVRIIPHSAQELKDGDLITLGTLKIETHIS